MHGKRGYDLLRDGKTRAEIAMALDVDWSIATKWPKHLAWKGYESWRDVKQEDRPEKLTGEQKKKPKETLDSGPRKYDYSTDLWTLKIIPDLILKEFGISYNTTHVWRVLRTLGYSA